MRWGFDGTGSALRSPFPWIALTAALALTAASWVGLERNRYGEARVQFERRTDTAVGSIRARMLAYEQILRSGAARIASSPSVSREEWRSFIANLQLEERFPGIQSVGYAEYVRAAARAEHVKRLRDEGFPDYELRPPGPREEMVPIVFNEPFLGRNQRVLGYDMYSEPNRQIAMDLARSTGEAAITGRVLLAGEAFRGTQPQQNGFVMYVPVFHPVARDLPRRDRGNAVSGYVFSPFRMHDLMQGILDEGVLQVLDMRIYDEPARGVQAEMIDTRTAWRATPAGEPAEFERIVNFPMPGRSWTIQFISRPEFDSALRAGKPWSVLAGGLLGSVVVFMLIVALVDAWNKAHVLSMRDPLTGLWNRRYLDETMSRELPRARRLNQGIGAIILDLDHFKQLNDTFGHDAGDFVLERVGELLRHATRGSDMPCRFGGEEFGVILPGASLESTRNKAEAIRAAFAAMSLDFEGAPLGALTLSAGVAALPAGKQDWGQVMRLADKALYTAKEAGRNRVIAATDD
ncbi:MAG TPA: CHASE domain-containing protein [Usitatibacter sp.]|nr:CHASE domain-containing protein [Usitatibacter sp.]